jgi:hypothetical protein
MKTRRHAAPLADNKRQYDAIIKALERACAQVEQAIGVTAGTAFTTGVEIIGRKTRSRPAGAHKIYAGLSELLQQAREERSALKED